jgi:serine/threonine-protein kinase RsbW
MIILSQTENLASARAFVEQEARANGFSDEEASKLELAVDEACTNIIRHAYHGASDKKIELEVIVDAASFQIRIYDNGVTFDPASVRKPDVQDQVSHSVRGGLGVYLMKKLVDTVEYHFHPGKKNEVRLTKYRSHAA